MDPNVQNQTPSASKRIQRICKNLIYSMISLRPLKCMKCKGKDWKCVKVYKESWFLSATSWGKKNVILQLGEIIGENTQPSKTGIYSVTRTPAHLQEKFKPREETKDKTIGEETWMIHKQIKICLTLLLIKEKQNRIAVKYNLFPKDEQGKVWS